MGVRDLIGDDLPVDENTTVADLVDKHGKEIVKRGLEYMDSLDEADREYKRAADDTEMSKGYERAGVDSDDENVDKASTKWARAVKVRGLGVDE